MNFFDKLMDILPAPQLTRGRIVFAMIIAVVADFLQIVLLPLEWMFIQQIVDVVAMVLTSLVLGFHLLLLPTFVIEFIPGVDMLPTWTGCVIAVIALRKRGQAGTPSVTSDLPPVIDVEESKPPRQIGPPPPA
jgi:hypothetical protein